jgi:pectate lyase
MTHTTPKRSRMKLLGAAAAAGGLVVAATSLVAPPSDTEAELTSTPQEEATDALTFQVDDEADGYASMNGGTTGGFGAETVDEVVLSEHFAQSGEDEPGEALYQLLRAHQDQPDHGLVVYVDMTIHEDDFGRSKIDVQDNFNVSLIGVGTEGEFDGVGFTVRRAHNIVFRNLAIHHVSQGEGTAIEVTDDSSNVWIDHNEFYSEFDGNDDSDYYDGLVDIKRNAEYITVSWNYLHDHWKTGLVGHNDNADLAPDNITFHHNWYSNLNSRTPLTRFADVHMLNNYFEDIHDTAINSRMGAQILVEGNYFLRTGSGEVDGETGDIKGPVGWFYGSSETGYWNLVDNIFEDSPSDHLESTTDFTVPYGYSADSPEDVPALVQDGAGVGVLDVTTP